MFTPQIDVTGGDSSLTAPLASSLLIHLARAADISSASPVLYYCTTAHETRSPSPMFPSCSVLSSCHEHITSAVFLGQIFSPLVYLTLIPVVAGVSIASLKELDFKVGGSFIRRESRGVPVDTVEVLAATASFHYGVCPGFPIHVEAL